MNVEISEQADTEQDTTSKERGLITIKGEEKVIGHLSQVTSEMHKYHPVK